MKARKHEIITTQQQNANDVLAIAKAQNKPVKRIVKTFAPHLPNKLKDKTPRRNKLTRNLPTPNNKEIATDILSRTFTTEKYGDFIVTKIVSWNEKNGYPKHVDIKFTSTKNVRRISYKMLYRKDISDDKEYRRKQNKGLKRKYVSVKLDKRTPTEQKKHNKEYILKYNKEYREDYRDYFNEYTRLNLAVNRNYKLLIKETDDLRRQVLARRLSRHYEAFKIFNPISAFKLYEKLNLSKYI